MCRRSESGRENVFRQMLQRFFELIVMMMMFTVWWRYEIRCILHITVIYSYSRHNNLRECAKTTEWRTNTTRRRTTPRSDVKIPCFVEQYECDGYTPLRDQTTVSVVKWLTH